MRNKGFTLIELVIVIVILGILAATAAPKFLDLSGDARASVIKGIEGSINSAADIVHAKALIDGMTGVASADEFVMIGDIKIFLNYGWPVNADIAKVVDISDADIDSGTDAGTFTHVGATNVSFCYASYDSSNISNAETRPEITSVVNELNSDGTIKTVGC